MVWPFKTHCFNYESYLPSFFLFNLFFEASFVQFVLQLQKLKSSCLTYSFNMEFSQNYYYKVQGDNTMNCNFPSANFGVNYISLPSKLTILGNQKDTSSILFKIPYKNRGTQYFSIYQMYITLYLLVFSQYFYFLETSKDFLTNLVLL